MSRISLMTAGLILILVGVQLNLVDSFVLTPQATEIWNKRLTGGEFEAVPGNYVATSNGYFSNSTSRTYPSSSSTSGSTAQAQSAIFPYSTANYRSFQRNNQPSYLASSRRFTASGADGRQKMITPPSWFCWPPIFLGAVLFLFGAAGTE